MKKTVALITACLILLCSCDMSGDYLAYQRGAIRCELDFTSDGREYSAVLTLSELPDEGARDMELVFTSPSTLVIGFSYVYLYAEAFLEAKSM